MPQAINSGVLAQDAKVKSFKQKATVSTLRIKVSVEGCVQLHLLWEVMELLCYSVFIFAGSLRLFHGGLKAGGARREGGDRHLSASLLEGIPSAPFRSSQPQGAESGVGFSKPGKGTSCPILSATPLRTNPTPQARPHCEPLGSSDF